MSLRFISSVLLMLAAVLWTGCGGSDAQVSESTDTRAPDVSSSDASVAPDTGTQPPADAPTITSFTAAKSTLTAGATTTLTAVFNGGSGTIDNGVGTVSSGVAIGTGTLKATTTFTLTVKGANGLTATRVATVAVVAAPVIDSFQATKSIVTTGNATMLTASFAGGDGDVDQGIGIVTSGVAKPTPSLSANTTFILRVTNAAGDSVTASATVTVVEAPSITSFVAAKSPLTKGHATELMGTFSGGMGSIDQGIGATTNGVGVSTGTLIANTTYTLTVTNDAGDQVSAATTVELVDVPTIASFTAGQSLLTAGKATQLVAAFTGGTGSVNQSVGPVISGVPKSTGIIDSDKTFTLTVTNEAGDFVTSDISVSVIPAPSIVGFSAASARVTRDTMTMLTGTFAGGTGTIDHGIGVVTSNSPVSTAAISARTTFTLTVTNSLGDSATAVAEVDIRRDLFVANAGGNAILVFDDDASGNVAPKRTISGASTQLSQPRSVCVVGDELVVASSANSRILTFGMDDAGNVAPKRVIAGPSTLLGTIFNLTVSGTEIFVSDYDTDRVSAFDLSAAGDATPTRTLFGPATLLDGPIGLAVDGTEVFIASFFEEKVLVHGAAANGNVAPLRQHAMPAAYGVLVNGNELIVSRAFSIKTVNKTTFAPVREITGAKTGIQYPWPCVISGAELLCSDPSTSPPRIATWPITGDGDVAPTRVISGAATSLSSPLGLAVH